MTHDTGNPDRPRSLRTPDGFRLAYRLWQPGAPRRLLVLVHGLAAVTEARSLDGGLTWTVEDPANFVGDGGTTMPAPGGLVFTKPGFALRAEGVGYHGSDASNGRFYYSEDRGHTWKGPFAFTGLMEDPNLKDTDCTARTGYLVTGEKSCLVFMQSAT